MQPGAPLPFQLTAFPSDRFQLLGQAGQGGMGRVLKARDRHLNRLVALKIPLQESPQALGRLFQEAQHQASLEHPNILSILELGLWQDQPCIVLPFVEGVGLDQACQGAPWQEIVGYVIQAARGVHAAHRAGLLHRDLKPQNMLVERGSDGAPRVLVTDFGLSVCIDLDSASLSLPLVGSPPFMSPEQLLGTDAMDPRTDVYSLGATLYALLTGTPPFLDSGAPTDSSMAGIPTRLAVARRAIEDPPVPPRQRCPDLPEDLETLILACLAKDPGHRPHGADLLADDLERILQGRDIQTRRLTRLNHLGRRGWTYLLAGAATVAVLCLGTVQILKDRAQHQADLAQHFEEAARELHDAHRLADLSPEHDRALSMDRIMNQFRTLRQEALSHGRSGRGAAAFLEGQAYLLDGRPFEALVALHRAWELGLRSPGLSEALGRCLFDLHLDERARNIAADLSAPPALPPAERGFHDLALAHTRALVSQGGGSTLLKAQIAYLDHQPETALKAVDAALLEGPWHHQALMIRHQILAERALESPDPVSFTQAAHLAQEALDMARLTGRSAPAIRLAQTAWLATQSHQWTYRFGSPRPGLLEAAVLACDSTLPLLPHHPVVLLTRANLRLQMAESSLSGWTQDPPALHCLDLAEADLKQIKPQGPAAVGAHQLLAWCCLLRAQEASEAHRVVERDAHLARALDHAQQARSASAMDPDIAWLEALVIHRQQMGTFQRGGTPPTLAPLREVMARWPEMAPLRLRFAILTLECVANLQGHAEDRSLDTLLQNGEDTLRPVLRIPHLRLDALISLARILRVRAARASLTGQDPGPALAQADELLQQALPQGLSLGVILQDEIFTVRYERAALGVERGNPMKDLRRALGEQLQSGERQGLRGAWLAVNWAALHRLDAIQALREGRDPRPYARRGMAALAGLPDPIPQEQGSPVLGLKAGFRHLLGGDPNTSRRLLAQAMELDPTLAWTFRFERAWLGLSR